MKQHFLFTKIVFALALIVVLIGFSAFSQNRKDSIDSFRKEQLSENINTDSSGRRYNTGGNTDKLDEQMRQLDIQMKNLEIQVKNMDFEKYQQQLNEAIKKIDLENITEQIDKSIKKTNWKNIHNQIEEQAKVNRLQINEAKKQMKQAKMNFDRQKIEFSLNSGKMKENFEKSMKNARQSLENAKEDLKNFRELSNALEKDGLIDKSKGYKIEVTHGELYINDKKQSKETNDKYRKYYRKGNFTINTNEENGIRI